MKKLIILTVISIVSILSAFTVYADDITIQIDGKKLETEVSPQNIDGRIMVPVRAIFEGVGAEVFWNQDTKTITGKKSDTTVIMTIGSSEININNEISQMDTSPVIIENRTYAPARFVAESFGYDVQWQSSSKTVEISNKQIAETTENTTTETTTQVTSAATEETTVVTTQLPYINSRNVLEEGVYNDLEGKYYLFSLGDKPAEYSLQYPDDESDFPTVNYVEYAKLLSVTRGYKLTLKNGVIVPENDVDTLDINRNGVFRVGTDIPAGSYNVNCAEGCVLGRINRTYIPSGAGVNVTLNKGDIVEKYCVDIYKADGTVVASAKKPTYNADITNNMDNVREEFKKQINTDYQFIINSLIEVKTDDLFKGTYKKQQINSWLSDAANEDEKAYVERVAALYEDVVYYTEYATMETMSLRSRVNQTVSSDIITVNTDVVNAYSELANKMMEAESFKDCYDINTESMYMRCMF